MASIKVYAHNMEFLSKREDEVSPSSDYNNEPVYTLPEINTQASSVSSLKSDDIPF